MKEGAAQRKFEEGVCVLMWFVLFCQSCVLCVHVSHAQVNRTITSLDLGDNDIGDEGAVVVADAMKVPLKSLYPSRLIFLRLVNFVNRHERNMT